MDDPPVGRILIPTQSLLLGDDALDSKIIFLEEVPTALKIPSFFI